MLLFYNSKVNYGFNYMKDGDRVKIDADKGIVKKKL